MSTPKQQPVLFQEGRNCWKVSHADKLAVLIDAEEYFHALAWALERAEESIFILSWDIDSRIRLLPDDPRTLSEFLISLVERKPELHIYILTWDYMILYANERESKRQGRKKFGAHPRIHFVFDKTGPLLVSLHQKVVVVDHQLAFCGGLDVTQRRWDNRHHHPHNGDRKSPDGDSYGPFHDVEIMLEGAVAQDLRQLCNERWKARTGQDLSIHPPIKNPDLWPTKTKPLLVNHSVALARTQPEHQESKGVYECKQLFLDSIRNARHTIFAENQYFTSQAIGEAILNRLKEDDPPEIVILVREESSKWLEQMGVPVMRSRLLRQLKKNDRHGRLKILCPTASQEQGTCINLHSKVFIVDDQFLRIGSANLNARSEGMDVECDIALIGHLEEDQKAIRSIRNRLLAEHLGVSEREIAAHSEKTQSLIATISHFQGKNDRTLFECPHRKRALIEWFTPHPDLVDPPSPIHFKRGIRRLITQIAVFALVIAAIPLLNSLLTQENIRAAAVWVNQAPWSWLGMIGMFALLTFFAFPLLPLTILFSLILPPLQTFAYTMIGALLSATALFSIAKTRAHSLDGWLKRIREKEAFQKMSKILRSHGWWPIVLIRLTPIAPYWVVNIGMGMLGIQYWQFLLSTVVGLLPGFVLISIFEDKISSQEGLLNKLVLLVAAFALLGWGIQKSIQRYFKKRESYAQSG